MCETEAAPADDENGLKEPDPDLTGSTGEGLESEPGGNGRIFPEAAKPLLWPLGLCLGATEVLVGSIGAGFVNAELDEDEVAGAEEPAWDSFGAAAFEVLSFTGSFLLASRSSNVGVLAF